MTLIQKKVLMTLVLALSFQFSQAASFEKYFKKLIKFEGKGFGIHQAIWGNKNFTKSEAFRIHKKFYWDKHHADLFENQEIAEVLIDHLINTGEGKECVNIKAFEALIGVNQDGVLSKEDIKAANDFAFPEQIINPYVNYRLYYYRTRKNCNKYPGWTVRAKTFMLHDTNGALLADYLILPKILINETNLQHSYATLGEVIAKK
jgi:Glycosyl hydrolase 108